MWLFGQVKSGHMSRKAIEADVVSESFRNLFPEDFDRALPIRDCKELDLLVAKWDTTMGLLERQEEYRERTGIRGKISRKYSTCDMSSVEHRCVCLTQ